MAASGSGGTLLTSASMSSRLTLGSCEVLVSLGVNAYRARRTAPDATMAGKRNVLMGGKDNKKYLCRPPFRHGDCNGRIAIRGLRQDARPFPREPSEHSVPMRLRAERRGMFIDMEHLRENRYEIRFLALFLNDFLRNCCRFVATYPKRDFSAAASSEPSSPRGKRCP